MKPGFFLKEALRTIKRNPIPSFAAMASVLVTVLVLGVFIPIVQATTGAANEVRNSVQLDVYAKTKATKADLARPQTKIRNTDHVKKVEFVSKEVAYAQQKKQNPEAYELLGSNPLPDTFRVAPDTPGNVGKLRYELAPMQANGDRAVIDPAIDEVKNRRDETTKILSATRVVKLSMAFLALLLVLASVLLISNTIRLSLFARRREVEVMKLVGATDWFIRWPFVLEGTLVGALGGVLAVLLLGVVKVAVVDPAIDEVKNRRDETTKILSATRVVKLSMAFLALLLVLASVLLISNTIRLSLFARRREVEVMKLVGATDWFIRWPFVIEGIIVGAIGGSMAILLLLVGKLAFIDPLKHDFSLIAAPETLNFGVLIIVLLVASVAVSAAGSGLSLRRFLRV